MALGAPIDIDPGEALLDEIRRTVGNIVWLEAKIQRLHESELVWGQVLEMVEERNNGEFSVHRTENRAVINGWYAIYAQERRHLIGASGAALRAGVEQRRVRMAERIIDTLEIALTGALGELGHDPHDAQVRAVVSTRLRDALASVGS